MKLIKTIYLIIFIMSCVSCVNGTTQVGNPPTWPLQDGNGINDSNGDSELDELGADPSAFTKASLEEKSMWVGDEYFAEFKKDVVLILLPDDRDYRTVKFDVASDGSLVVDRFDKGIILAGYVELDAESNQVLKINLVNTDGKIVVEMQETDIRKLPKGSEDIDCVSEDEAKTDEDAVPITVKEGVIESAKENIDPYLF